MAGALTAFVCSRKAVAPRSFLQLRRQTTSGETKLCQQACRGPTVVQANRSGHGRCASRCRRLSHGRARRALAVVFQLVPRRNSGLPAGCWVRGARAASVPACARPDVRQLLPMRATRRVSSSCAESALNQQIPSFHGPGAEFQCICESKSCIFLF